MLRNHRGIYPWSPLGSCEVDELEQAVSERVSSSASHPLRRALSIAEKLKVNIQSFLSKIDMNKIADERLPASSFNCFDVTRRLPLAGLCLAFVQ